MAANQPRTTSGPITGINVTPLVDITLVLLIIFMVTAKLIVSHSALPVDLPKALTGGEVQELFSVVLAPDVAAQVNGAKLDADDDLLALARAAHAKDEDLRAVINADGNVRHERVMRVLDLLRQSGISKIGFGVLPVTSTTP